MRSLPFLPHCLIASLPLLLLASGASGQSTSALLNEALDKQVNLQINTVLPQAMKQIADKTGVRIEVPLGVYELLPWGQETTISATIQNKTLRESLGLITRKLGLTFVLGENAVVLKPVPPLARLGRRSTLQELQLLDLLSTTPISGLTARPTLRQVTEAVDAQLLAIKADFVVENRAPQGSVQEALIPVPRGASMAEALEAIAAVTNVTWYPWGKSVVVLPKEDQIRSLLQKPVTQRWSGADVSQVLLELSKLTGVDFSIEPGAVQRITPEFRTIKLVVDNASVQQVLENLSASTGLGYVVTDKSVYIWNNSPIPGGGMATAQSTSGGGKTLLLVPLDLGGPEFLVPDADVPDDVKEYLKAQREKTIEWIRGRMKKEGFKPSTPPATSRPGEDL